MGTATDAESLEALAAAERRLGTYDDDDSVYVAVLWNGRILNLVHRLVSDILADRISTDDRKMNAIVTRAYQKTLAKHHNWMLRPAAKALLKMTPDRRTL